MLVDYVLNLGLDAVKEKICEANDQHKVKEALKCYIDNQRYFNYNCTREEEVDFGGLTDYICNELPKDVEDRLFGKTSEIRGRAHKSIVSRAAAYAKVHTQLQEKRVQHFVSDALNILRDFYHSRLSREYKYLFASIVDEVVESNKVQHDEQTDKIMAHVSEKAKEIISNSLLSLENNLKLIKQGNLNQVDDNLTEFVRVMGSMHILAPYYGFEPQIYGKKQKLVSVPLTEEAQRLYPPHFKCCGTVTIDGKTIEELTPGIFQYADNHQLPITLIVEDACKFLGSYVDPQQCEAANLVGQEIPVLPKPFPKAMAYNVSINSMVMFEYILLRIKEKFEDETVIFSNEEQNIPFSIQIRANPITKKVDFAFKVNGNSNRDLVRYKQFQKMLYSGGFMIVHHLESGFDLLKVNLDPGQSLDRVTALEQEIEFVNNVITIERYFDRVLAIPEQLYENDVELVNYVASLIQGKEIRGGWTKYEFSIPIGPNTKENLISSIGIPLSLTYVGTGTASIFGGSYTYPCRRTLTSVKFADPDKVQKKLDVLEQGDEIRIVLLPDGEEANGTYIDRLGKDDDNDE